MSILTSKATIAAIENGGHGDPFSVFGLHETGSKTKTLVLRTFQPGARFVHVVDAETGEALAELKPAGDQGFFHGEIPSRKSRFTYRIRIGGQDGEREIEDPYRFGPVLGELDMHLICEGTHHEMHKKLGAHLTTHEGVPGVSFAVWAPNAQRVSVVGHFNRWDGRVHPMRKRVESGIWEIFLPHFGAGEVYKYEIVGADGTLLPLKADPFAFFSELRPSNASIVYDLSKYEWNDHGWMQSRAERAALEEPISIYEVHLGSWRRRPDESFRFLTYREMADELVPYVRDMGFTHMELLPVNEHPFDGSWGYQPIGLFAPTSRFGSPDDFSYFVDRAHQEGIGIIIDWVPGHFPTDAHGLGWFDGTHLYEHADPRQGMHRDWGTYIYNFGRREVANFLISNALFWLEQFHIDGLRVDAVASMLYLDYSREAGEWIPNQYGGNENLEAIDFLKRTNEAVYGRYPGISMYAEESTAWPMVSRPIYLGGLGFGFKWNMGWMHDTLDYMSKDPVFRRFHQDRLTFGLLYQFSENFVLPLSHDEVVHGKGSLLGRMPGDRWQKFANLRAYFGFMFTHPGKKLLFMGGEFGQEREWTFAESLDWHLLGEPFHEGIQRLVRDLNDLYRRVPALHQIDGDPRGFEWIDCTDADNSVISYLRRGKDANDIAIVVSNFTPVVRENYRLGAPLEGDYAEVLNTDSEYYQGSNVHNGGRVSTEEIACHGRPYSLNLTLPPLATLVLQPVRG